jgi:hypothetical protein
MNFHLGDGEDRNSQSHAGRPEYDVLATQNDVAVRRMA